MIKIKFFQINFKVFAISGCGWFFQVLDNRDNAFLSLLLPIKIFGEIKKLNPGQGGEIHITDAIKSLIKKKYKFYGNIFKGKYLDCGTLNGYINSGIQISKGK